MSNKHLALGILLSLIFLSGCNSTYDPDDPIIERNFWNRTEMLDGVYLIIVRGDIVVWEDAFVKLGSVEEDGSDFDEVKKIYRQALTRTCTKGVREEISYKAYFRVEDMPDGSVVLPNFLNLEFAGPRYYEPFIEAVVQCVGSTASDQAIDETFRMEEIVVDETISNIELDFEKLIDNN